jgi:hypothetical protein
MTGRDLSEQLPPDVKFPDQNLMWQEVTVPVTEHWELRMVLRQL